VNSFLLIESKMVMIPRSMIACIAIMVYFALFVIGTKSPYPTVDTDDIVTYNESNKLKSSVLFFQSFLEVAK
jgi:hypothetical protein